MYYLRTSIPPNPTVRQDLPRPIRYPALSSFLRPSSGAAVKMMKSRKENEVTVMKDKQKISTENKDVAQAQLEDNREEKL